MQLLDLTTHVTSASMFLQKAPRFSWQAGSMICLDVRLGPPKTTLPAHCCVLEADTSTWFNMPFIEQTANGSNSLQAEPYVTKKNAVQSHSLGKQRAPVWLIKCHYSANSTALQPSRTSTFLWLLAEQLQSHKQHPCSTPTATLSGKAHTLQLAVTATVQKQESFL